MLVLGVLSSMLNAFVLTYP